MAGLHRRSLGAAPDIRYFETAVVVDNESDKILDEAA